ncbi:MAG: sensor histidine kinase [Magnetospirillum sp.]|nr:sensor histidine kinase [Magnetospirillum sp.]
MRARLAALAFHDRHRHLPLAIRVALLPLLVVTLFAVLFLIGSAALRTQQESMTAVVETDLESSARLADINSRLQSANTDMYRLITRAAAAKQGGDFAPRIVELSARVEAIAADLERYRDGQSAVQRETLDTFIDDLRTYKGAIDWLGSMLDIDFKTAVAFVEPYNRHVDALSRQLSDIIADSTRTAKVRAETASDALRRVAYSYVVAAVTVSILVALFGYASGRRQEVLYKAARQKSEQVNTLLDNSGQGFLSFGADLIVAEGHSRACTEMLGIPPAGRAADALLFSGRDDEAGALMRLVVAKALAEPEPDRQAVLLSLLPAEITLGDKTLAVEYRPLGNGALMLVLTDVTEARSLARQVERERKRLEMIVAAVSDGHDFFGALAELRRFVGEDMAAPQPLATVYRQVHTFKGTFSQFSFQHLPAALHALEHRLQAMSEAPETADAAAIRRALSDADCPGALERDLAAIRDVLGEDFLAGEGTIQLSMAQFKRIEHLAARLAESDPAADGLCEALAALRTVPLKAALADYAPLVGRLAERCDKDIAPLVVEGDEVSVPAETYHPFLRALGHVLRNAVDHGIEAPDVRLDLGKDPTGRIVCSVHNSADAVRIDIADDGAGLDLAALRRAAAARLGDAAAGLSDERIADVVFADGLSTAAAISDLSGRGVGLAAVRSAAEALGGTASVVSRRHQGTRFIFNLPHRQRRPAEAA